MKKSPLVKNCRNNKKSESKIENCDLDLETCNFQQGTQGMVREVVFNGETNKVRVRSETIEFDTCY